MNQQEPEKNSKTSSDKHRNFISGTTLLSGALMFSSFAPTEAIAMERPVIQNSANPARSTTQIFDHGLNYFLDARTESGLILDRMTNLRGQELPREGVASLAATGYGLAALPLACEKGSISREEAEQMLKKTLDTVEELSRNTRGGWLYHFVDSATGEPAINSEVSSVDTILFYYGAIVAGEYVGGEERDRVYTMLHNLDFDMMRTNDGACPDSLDFSHGYRIKENGEIKFIRSRWDRYSEGILIPFLALGATSLDAEIWSKGIDRTHYWKRDGLEAFDNLPLFTHYYPLGFIPCKDMVDSTGTDYWKEASNAVKMQLLYCDDKDYPEKLFGLTACDGPDGYHAYYPDHPYKGKVIAPLAVAACLPIEESITREALTELDRLHLLNGRYGAIAAFEVESGWTASETLGIDIGSTLLMLDIHDRGLVHSLLRKSPVIQKAMQRSGFTTER